MRMDQANGERAEAWRGVGGANAHPPNITNDKGSCRSQEAEKKIYSSVKISSLVLALFGLSS